MATVTDVMTSSQGYASNAVASADTFLSSLATITNTRPLKVSYSISVYEDWLKAKEAINKVLANKPSSADIDIDMANWPLVPAAPTLNPISPISDVTIPAFGASAPSLTFPAAPTSPAPVLNVTAPVINPITVPTKPQIDDKIPVAPVIDFSKINVPDPITLEFSQKDLGTLADFNISPPANTFEFAEVAYSSALLDKLKSTLLDALENGAYVNSALWDDMWNRSKDRQAKVLDKKRDEITRATMKSGFPVPPGYLASKDIEAFKEYQGAILEQDREITLKEAQVHVDNWKFSITETRNTEQLLINYHMSVMERALNSQKLILDASISIFNANIAKSEANNKIYIARASVYKTEIEATVAKANAWRTQLEGAKLQGELQGLQVELYKSLLEGLMVYIELYKAEMQGAKIGGEIEKMKADIYSSQVGAYAQEVNAFESQFRAYKAQIDGEVAKVTAFKAEADAFRAEVDAEKAKVEIETLKLSADVQANEALLSEYKSQITQYSSQFQAVISEIQSKTAVYTADIDAYRSEMAAYASMYELERTAFDNNADRLLKVSALEVDAAKAELQHFVGMLSARAQAGAAGADVYKGIVMASLSAVNSLSSMIEYTDKT